MKPLLCLGLLVWLGGAARADNGHDAGKHFARGVELYNDGDFRGALVEFKTAYGIWPRANVLYDIGQTQYQLLEYAAALATMQQYLAETGPNAAHRAEVEGTVEVLRGRVGEVALRADAADCEVSVDDQAAGTTPLLRPLVVSVGPRTIVVACPGRPTVSRHVEVAAGETVQLAVQLPSPPPVTRNPPPPPPRRPTRAPLLAGWSVTALLGGALVGVGSAALAQSGQLAALKRTFPVTHEALAQKSALVSGLAISADTLAAATLLAAGLSTYLTVKYGKERRLRIGLHGMGVALRGAF